MSTQFIHKRRGIKKLRGTKSVLKKRATALGIDTHQLVSTPNREPVPTPKTKRMLRREIFEVKRKRKLDKAVA